MSFNSARVVSNRDLRESRVPWYQSRYFVQTSESISTCFRAGFPVPFEECSDLYFIFQRVGSGNKVGANQRHIDGAKNRRPPSCP